MSIGDIWQQLNEAPHRVKYAIAKLAIKPAAKIGGRCLYHKSNIERIRAELAKIDGKKKQKLSTAGETANQRGVTLTTAAQSTAGGAS